MYYTNEDIFNDPVNPSRTENNGISERSGSRGQRSDRRRMLFTARAEVSGKGGERRTMGEWSAEREEGKEKFEDASSNVDRARRMSIKGKQYSHKSEEDLARKRSKNCLNEVNDLLQGIEDPSEIDPQDIDLILKLRSRKQRPMADPLTDIGVDPLMPLKSRNVPSTQDHLGRNTPSSLSDGYLPTNVEQPERAGESESGPQSHAGRGGSWSRQSSRTRRNSSTRASRLGGNRPQLPRSGLPACGASRAGQTRKEARGLDCSPGTRREVRGQLHHKISELKDEISRLENEYNGSMADLANLGAYEKKVKELAAELTEMQCFLTELNTAADKSMFHSSDCSKGAGEVEDLRKSNDRMAENIEIVFAKRLRKEEEVTRLEKKLERERSTVDANISVKEKLKKYPKQVEWYQIEVESLKRERDSLEESLRTNPLKYRLLALERECRELRRREGISKDESTGLKEETAYNRDEDEEQTENKSCKMFEGIRNAERFLAVNDDSEETELEGNEETLERLISSIDSKKKSLTDKIDGVENKIRATLSRLNGKLSVRRATSDYIRGNAQGTDGGFLQNLSGKPVEEIYERLSECFTEIGKMQAKLSNELATLEIKAANLCEQLEEFNSCKKLEENVEDRRRELLEAKGKVERESECIEESLEWSRNRHEELRKEISENRQFLHIALLENKMAGLAEKQFFLLERIDEIKTKICVEELKKHTLELLNDINTFLVDNIYTL